MKFFCKFNLIGMNYEGTVLPRVCFTTDTPIKFAFFCNLNFVEPVPKNKDITAIGIIGNLMK